MEAMLQQRFRQIQEANETLEARVAERTGELAATRDRLDGILASLEDVAWPVFLSGQLEVDVRFMNIAAQHSLECFSQ